MAWRLWDLLLKRNRRLWEIPSKIVCNCLIYFATAVFLLLDSLECDVTPIAMVGAVELDHADAASSFQIDMLVKPFPSLPDEYAS